MLLFLGMITYQLNWSKEWTQCLCLCVLFLNEISLMWSLSLFSWKSPACLIWYSKCPLIILELQGERVRERQREWKKKNNKLNCHMQVHLHSSATACQACHTPTTLCLVFTSRTVIFWTVVSHSRTTHFDRVRKRFLKCAVCLPWQWLPYTLPLNFQCKGVTSITVLILTSSCDTVLHVVKLGSALLPSSSLLFLVWLCPPRICLTFPHKTYCLYL